MEMLLEGISALGPSHLQLVLLKHRLTSGHSESTVLMHGLLRRPLTLGAADAAAAAWSAVNPAGRVRASHMPLGSQAATADMKPQFMV